MVGINPQKLHGKWISGVALDFHTVSSVYLGVNDAGQDVYDTKRTELGESVYRLKYRGRKEVVPQIVEAAAGVLKRSRRKFDILVPVPPSGGRGVQPVMLLAKEIGAAIDLPVIDCISLTRSATPLKGVMEREARAELLEGLHRVDDQETKGKNVLLFDDVFRSGATMSAITELLTGLGEAKKVYCFTITKTRRNR